MAAASAAEGDEGEGAAAAAAAAGRGKAPAEWSGQAAAAAAAGRRERAPREGACTLLPSCCGSVEDLRDESEAVSHASHELPRWNPPAPSSRKELFRASRQPKGLNAHLAIHLT